MSDLKKKYDKEMEDITTEMEDMKKNFQDIIEDQASKIKSLGTRGTWCGYKHSWKTVGTITYENLTISNSNNMEITRTPLDINTGI